MTTYNVPSEFLSQASMKMVSDNEKKKYRWQNATLVDFAWNPAFP